MDKSNRDSKNIRPLVSIIIPVWDNSYKTLDNAVNSILNQWFKNKPITMEIVFVDDGSKDRATKRKLEVWERRLRNNQELPHISSKIFTHLQNKGISCARNSGICNSSSKYVCYLDSDDVYYPCRIYDAITTLEENKEFDIVSSAVEFNIWNQFKEKYENSTKHSSITVLGITHTRDISDNVMKDYGDIFPSFVVDNEVSEFIDRLKRYNNIKFIDKKSGLCTISQDGQYFTKRMPGSGRGITYTDYKNNNY